MCTQDGNIADNVIFLPDKYDRRNFIILFPHGFLYHYHSMITDLTRVRILYR